MSADYSNIPDELQERDQWLLWDASHDTPRQPHWDGDFYGISWSDPDDWHSFEEAVELAATDENWGIGYVMSKNNDHHPRGLYGCIDLDDCMKDDLSGTKDWVPDLSFFFDDDAYGDYSPSGTGIHIPFVGQDEPEWWTDSHFSPDEHEGVDVLTNKFVTFTGDMVSEAGDTVCVSDPSEFLRECYEAINGEDPAANTGAADEAEPTTLSEITSDRTQTPPSEDAELSESDVADALDVINSGCGYNEWRNILYAIHAWDSGTTGKQLAEQWSRGSGWDDDSQEKLDTIWSEASQGSEITVATLIEKAKNNGWTPPRPTKPEPEERTTAVVSSLPDDYEPSDGYGDDIRDPIAYPSKEPFDWDIPDGESIGYHASVCAWSRVDELDTVSRADLIRYAVISAQVDGLLREQILIDFNARPSPDTAEDEPSVQQLTEDMWAEVSTGEYDRPTFGDLAAKGILPERWSDGAPSPGGMICRSGGYDEVIRDNETGEIKRYVEITNFHLRVQSRLEYPHGKREFELRVVPADGDSYTVTVEPTDLNEIRTFRESVLTGWSTTFDGGQKDLNKIKQFIAGQNAPLRIGTERIGLHESEFVTPAGVLDADGWTDDPDTRYTDERSQLNPLWELAPDTVDTYDTDTVASMLELLPQTRDSERFLPVLGWFYAAAAKPYVMDWNDEFNVLNVLGDTGSGKTTTLETLWQLFGVEGELLAADTTGFTMLTAISSTNAVPVVFDEYKPADMKDYIVDDLKKYIRLSTRGGIESKGTADQSTNNYRLTAPVCLSGEQPLQGPAEERRSILTTFTRDVISGETPETKAFQQLTGGEFKAERFDGYPLGEHGFAYYRWLLDQDEDDLHDAWRSAREKVSGFLTECGVTVADLDDMVIQGFQTVWFGVGLYRGFCAHVGVDGRSVIPDRDLEAAIAYLLDEGTGFEHVSHLDRLMAILSRAADAEYVEPEVHYTVVSPRGPDSPDAELCVRIDSAFDKVRQYCRDHDVKESDILNSADDYRPRIRDNHEQDGYVSDSSKKSRFDELDGTRRAVAFDLDAVAASVDDVAAGAFDKEATESDADAESEPVALASRSPGRMQEFTATVASVNYGEYDRTAQGELQGDVVGTYIGYVVPGNNDDIQLMHKQGDRLHFENVTIRRNDDDLLEAVIDNTVTITDVPSGSDQSGSVPAETDGDGGDNADTGADTIEEIRKDVIDAVVELTGDAGAAHKDVVRELTDQYAVPTIEDGIQDALNTGRIYESATRQYRRE